MAMTPKETAIHRINSAAQRLADDANVAFWMMGKGNTFNEQFHEAEMIKRIAKMEARIAEYREATAVKNQEAAE